MDYDEYMGSEDSKIDADQSLADAVKQFNSEDPEPKAAEEPAQKEPPKEDEPPAASEPATAPKPQEQSMEERARNAERRRQHESSIAQKALETSTEFKMVQALARMSGKTPDQLYQDVYQAQIAHEAQIRGQELPPEAVAEIARERQAVAQSQQQNEQLGQQLTQLQYEQWAARIENEKNQILGAHPYLTETDVTAARDYMLTVLNNPHVPLEEAVYAIHGRKIIQGQQEKMRTELLAEMSGRKNAPLPPQGKATPPENMLTADERFVARMLGISEEDYLKNKS